MACCCLVIKLCPTLRDPMDQSTPGPWTAKRVPWTAKRSDRSILKEINPEFSLKGQILKLRLQYYSHLMRREDSLEKTLMLGKCEGKRRRGITEDEMVAQCH